MFTICIFWTCTTLTILSFSFKQLIYLNNVSHPHYLYQHFSLALHPTSCLIFNHPLDCFSSSSLFISLFKANLSWHFLVPGISRTLSGNVSWLSSLPSSTLYLPIFSVLHSSLKSHTLLAGLCPFGFLHIPPLDFFQVSFQTNSTHLSRTSFTHLLQVSMSQQRTWVPCWRVALWIPLCFQSMPWILLLERIAVL